MRKRIDIAVIAVAVFLVIIAVGEATIYAANPYHCSVDVRRSGDVADYSFDTNIGVTYTCVSLDNSSNHVNGYLAYYDEDYNDTYYRQDVYRSLSYLKDMLKKYSIDLRFVDTDELTSVISSGNTGDAVIFATGCLPDTIYTGQPSDPIFGWLSAGGYMYWLGPPVGSQYFDPSGAVHNVDKPDGLFFGANDVIRTSEGTVFDNSIVKGSLTDVTHQYYNECTYGVDVSKLVTPYTALDYSSGGYHAVTFVKYHSGTGTIAVFGGGLNKYVVGADVAQPVAQTIASRTTYDTAVIDYVSGNNAKGASGTVRCTHGATDVYIFLTTGDVVFGRNVTV